MNCTRGTLRAVLHRQGRLPNAALWVAPVAERWPSRSAPSSSSASAAFATAAAAPAAAATLKFQVRDDVAELGRGSGPLALFEALVRDGELQEDAGQRRVLEYLTAVFHGAPTRTSRGLYLYGSVGCGKTMSMDLFYSTVKDVPGLRVDRKHFHDFLHDVQVKLHQLRKDKGPGSDRPVIERVAETIAQQTDVLCFDEMAVTTIQDCCILLPLFSTLFERGVTMVATSNRAPEDLYTDGLNRHIYLPPFLEMLKMNCKVHHLEGSTDYRAVHFENSADAGVFCWPPDRGFLDDWLNVATEGAGGKPAHLDVSFGRQVPVPQLSDCGRVARFSFTDLCMNHLSADDYLTICRRVHTILLDDVPLLTVDNHNEARRFTTLIDSCYEHHVRLIASMAGPPEKVLGNLAQLRDIGISTLGGGQSGGGDGDTATSGVLQAIGRIKKSRAEHEARRCSSSAAAPGGLEESQAPLERISAQEVLSAEVQRVQSHGTEDINVWRQGGGAGPTGQGENSSGAALSAPPQVSRAWDDRRRISQFTWESMDPTSEQQTIKGVFTAAVASLKESGFAVERAISRLREMQTDTFQQNHRLKHLT